MEKSKVGWQTVLVEHDFPFLMTQPMLFDPDSFFRFSKPKALSCHMCPTLFIILEEKLTSHPRIHWGILYPANQGPPHSTATRLSTTCMYSPSAPPLPIPELGLLQGHSLASW